VDLFIEQLMNGLAIGAIYALITSGLSLIYGILRILHVAHAGVYTIGAYVGLTVYSLSGSLVIAILASMAVCSIVGILIERVVYSPLLKFPPYVPLIASIALLLGVEEVMRLIAGPQIHGFPVSIPLPTITMGNVSLSPTLLMVYIVSIVIFFILWFITSKTDLGLAMRAVSQDMSIASAMGINSTQIVRLTFAIGSSIAAIAGILVGIYFNQVYPTMGAVPAYKTLALIVVGGLGSVPGAILASLLLGIAETLLIGYANIPFPRDAIAFVAMILVLMVRPQGLLGNVRKKI
jgi:branched-chain amino acid transport system permease protein